MSTSLSEQIAEGLGEVFHCAWGGHRAPMAEAADGPATVCLDCLDEIAELEQRDRALGRQEIA